MGREHGLASSWQLIFASTAGYTYISTIVSWVCSARKSVRTTVTASHELCIIYCGDWCLFGLYGTGAFLEDETTSERICSCDIRVVYRNVRRVVPSHRMR